MEKGKNFIKENQKLKKRNLEIENKIMKYKYIK